MSFRWARGVYVGSSTQTGLWWTRGHGNGGCSVLGLKCAFATAASQSRSSAAIPGTAVGSVKWLSSCLELASIPSLARDYGLAKWLRWHGWLGRWNASAAKREKSIVTLRDNGGESVFWQCAGGRKADRQNDINAERGCIPPGVPQGQLWTSAKPLRMPSRWTRGNLGCG